MDGSDKTLGSLVEMIFTKIPKPECTYTVAVAEQISSEISLFQLLMNILVAGAKKLYGDNITPNDISEDQFEELKTYIRSIGYEIKHNYKFLIDDPDIDDKYKPRIMNIWFEPIIPKYNCRGRKIL